jgi:hypothetical protein
MLITYRDTKLLIVRARSQSTALRRLVEAQEIEHKGIGWVRDENGIHMVLVINLRTAKRLSRSPR